MSGGGSHKAKAAYNPEDRSGVCRLDGVVVEMLALIIVTVQLINTDKEGGAYQVTPHSKKKPTHRGGGGKRTEVLL